MNAFALGNVRVIGAVTAGGIAGIATVKYNADNPSRSKYPEVETALNMGGAAITAGIGATGLAVTSSIHARPRLPFGIGPRLEGVLRATPDTSGIKSALVGLALVGGVGGGWLIGETVTAIQRTQ